MAACRTAALLLVLVNGAAAARGEVLPVDRLPQDMKPFSVCPLEMRGIAGFEQSQERPKKLYVRYEDGRKALILTASTRAEMLWGTFEDYAVDQRWIVVRERSGKKQIASHVIYLPALQEVKADNFGASGRRLQVLDLYNVYSAEAEEKIDVLGVKLDGQYRQYALAELEAALNRNCVATDPAAR